VGNQMTEENLNQDSENTVISDSETISSGSSTNEKAGDANSLMASAKGIWPLIFSVIILVIYIFASVIMFIYSYKFGRI
jgi:hypothetical protein